MVEQSSETMPEDVRQGFADAVRLFNRWKAEPGNVPAPAIDFRRLKVSLSGICVLVAAYRKNQACEFRLQMTGRSKNYWTNSIRRQELAKRNLGKTYARSHQLHKKACCRTE
jgi:hypothetical protein